MSMTIPYGQFIDNLETTLIADDRFKVNNAGKYVHQIEKQRMLKGGALPALLLYVGSKPREPHRAIGYSPFPLLYLIVRTIVDSPCKNLPAALLAELEETSGSAITPKVADYANYKLVETVEEVLRGDESTTGKLARRLQFGTNVKYSLPQTANFGVQEYDGSTIVWGEVILEVNLRLVAS